jgi:homeobox protein ESX1
MRRYIGNMSENEQNKDSAPILHRYDPQKAAIPPFPGAKPSVLPAEKPVSSDKIPVPNAAPVDNRPVEIGGPTGPEPTRYGDWERNGRVSDF